MARHSHDLGFLVICEHPPNRFSGLLHDSTLCSALLCLDVRCFLYGLGQQQSSLTARAADGSRADTAAGGDRRQLVDDSRRWDARLPPSPHSFFWFSIVAREYPAADAIGLKTA